jgi:hypothetical protein
MNPGLRITELTMIISEMWARADTETKVRLQQEHEKNKIITAYEKDEHEKLYGHVEKKKRSRKKKISKTMGYQNQPYVPQYQEYEEI